MNKSNLHTGLFAFLLGSILLVSCGSLKPGDKSSEVLSERQVMRTMETQQFPYEWMTAKAHGRWSDEYGSQGFSIQFRMQKDRAIWLSATKFGFELARVLIKKDSVFYINRLTNEYFAEPLQYLEELGFPVSFHDLQQLLMGRPLQSIRHYTMIERDTNRYLLRSVRDNPGLTEEYILQGPEPTIERMRWTDRQNRTVKTELSEYQDITDNKIFSYFRVFKLMGLSSDEPSLELDFREVQLDNPASMPFRIPPSYSRLE